MHFLFTFSWVVTCSLFPQFMSSWLYCCNFVHWQSVGTLELNSTLKFACIIIIKCTSNALGLDLKRMLLVPSVSVFLVVEMHNLSKLYTDKSSTAGDLSIMIMWHYVSTDISNTGNVSMNLFMYSHRKKAVNQHYWSIQTPTCTDRQWSYYHLPTARYR